MHLLRRSTHSQRLERWIGAEQVEALSQNMRGWYGPPVPLLNLPGRVFARGDGDFVGDIKGGFYFSLADYAEQRLKRIVRNTFRRGENKLNTGFGSFSDLISEATTGGKRQDWNHAKTGTGAVAGRHYSLWNVGPSPAAGGTPAARPGGAVPTNATTGSLQQTDPGGSDTLHITTLLSQATTAPNTLQIYDRIYHASAISHTINTAQSNTGVPTRYATTTSPGNFAFLEVTAALGATASNVRLQYVDNAGNAAENAPDLATIVSSVATQIPHFPWFIPLNGGDTGLRSVANVTLLTANTAGTSNLVMGHQLALAPQPVANSMVVMDGINSAFNLVQVLAGACVAYNEWKGVGSASSYLGNVVLVSG